MSQDKDNTIDTNAQASALGWDFQSSLALFYIINDIKKIKKIKVEGKVDDIELEYETGDKVFIQAKAKLNPFNDNNVDMHLKNALKSLINSSLKSEYSNLIYGTNIENPFVLKKYKSLFTGNPTKYTFNELPDAIRKKIKKNAEAVADNENLSMDLFDYNKLQIITLPFFGDDDETRYRFIKERVLIFLDKIGLDKVQSNRVYEIFLLDFTKNASKSIHIGKGNMAWTIIVYALENDNDDFYTEFDLDIGEEDAIQDFYRGFIDRKTVEFSLLNEVEEHFKELSKKRIFTSRRSALKEFIDSNVNYYEGKIFFDEKDDLTEGVTKVILWNILKKRRLIAKLSEEVGI